MTIENLLETFFTNYVERRLKPNTIAGYAINIQKHILPYLADYEIDELNYDIIDCWVDTLVTKKGLSNTSCRYALATLRKALNFGIKRNYCTSNLLREYDMPRKEPFQYTTFSADQLNRLLLFSKDDDIFPAILLASLYGLRRGECAGLHSFDISPDCITIKYSASVIKGKLELTDCKNSRVRTILITRETFRVLKQYDSIRSPNPDGYLIRHSDGRSIAPTMINEKFDKILEKAGLPHIRFHDLRHSYATLMLKNNVHPKIVQQVLGHSDISVTLNLYSHADISMQKQCIDILDSVITSPHGHSFPKG